ncbi:hypothetical protein AFAEC_1079 [Aliarcobacter faecis]|uniref:hypothetical protein n=1 Tax=Aliarcobacter faecis TaxID=1564138 RepID=UPI00047ED1DD|nr:hypothetical protein [Aliarcobacter faecis]QKF73246.1 hypothetical protein AFAEC_1079 [Aliarcobacter faecis]
MKKEEKIVFEYLTSLGFNNISYEPLGFSTFPDFGIDREIGVEVRRLNRNHIYENEIPEVDNLNSKYKNEINKILNSIQQDTKVTYFIDFKIKKSNSTIHEKSLFKNLKNYLKTCDTNSNSHNIDKNLNMTLVKGSFDCEKKFKFNAIQLPFFFIEEQYLKDIQFCIKDKQKKIDVLNDKTIFSEYWLVLIDCLFYDNLTEYEFDFLELKDFSKVIIINKDNNKIRIIHSNKLKEDL